MGCSKPSSSIALSISGIMPSSSNVIYYLLSIIYSTIVKSSCFFSRLAFATLMRIGSPSWYVL